MSAEDPAFDAFFERCSGGHPPYEYQREVAARLFGGAHLDVWAPTGAGKTLSVLVPFLWQFERGGKPRWDRLLYVLPLRSLVESIAAEARSIVADLGVLAEDDVRVQTGENPGDPFFHEGRVILTTYDQLLSGALEGPYGLPDMLHNINTAAVAGALVVFDEYHLMQPNQAFLTAVAHLELYKPLCQSVWMTATATSPLRKMLRQALDAAVVDVEPDELKRMPAVSEVNRRVKVMPEPLTAEIVWQLHQSRNRSIALANTVARANELHDELVRLAPAETVILLHSQFIPRDRQRIEQQVRQLFGKDSTARAILVCTQVIEAGMNISAEVLHTDVAPMSALVQRAGRCARFPGESGEVLVYPLPEMSRTWWRPYEREDVEHSLATLSQRSGAHLDPTTMRELVDAAHEGTAARLLRGGWSPRQRDIAARTHATVVLRRPEPISDLIRASDGQTIRVVIAGDPIASTLNPYAVEGFGLWPWNLKALFEQPTRPIGWRWTPSEDQEWTSLDGPVDVDRAFVICLHPGVASYTKQRGLRLGQVGTFQSPPRERPRRKRSGALHQESWARHAREVGEEAALHAGRAGAVLYEGLRDARWQISEQQLVAAARAVGLLHDVGKLQQGWQDWAERAQRSLNVDYVHSRPLAHTDFNREDPRDRVRERSVNEKGRRPPHAAASAWYSARTVVSLLRRAPEQPSRELRAACLAGMLGHHGGWISRSAGRDLGVQPLVGKADDALQQAAQIDDLAPLVAPGPSASAADTLEKLLEPVAEVNAWAEWIPIVSYLARTLRLADQRATSMYRGEE